MWNITLNAAGRRALVLSTALAGSAMLGCSGTNVDSSRGTFWSSGTASHADTVRLVGAGVSGDKLTVLVRLGGPTTSADLSTFDFDLLLSDPTVASYIAGSAIAGSALDSSGGQNLVVNASQSLERIGVHVTNTSSGSGVASGEATIVALRFRILKAGSTALSFAPTPAPSAFDAAVSPVSTITFDAAPAGIVGN